MIQQIKSNVWKFSFRKFGSHVYLAKLESHNILIDASSSSNSEELSENLKELGLTSGDINIIIFTHSHWDHTGRTGAFPNSKFYGSKNEFEGDIEDIKNLNISELKIIEIPGHSKGGICILYENILFSGDTIFHRGTIGRTDLPGSSEEDMKKSLKKLKKIDYKILCPGHGREQK